MRLASGIVLCGGRSERMGKPKATLDFHGTALVRRVAGLLERSVAGPVVIVRAPGQQLPDLPDRWTILDDAVAHRGPLGAMAAGLQAAECAGAKVAFVCSTDLALLAPSFVRATLERLGDHDACVPVADGRPQPLAAAYATATARVAAGLAPGERASALYLAVDHVLVDVAELDPARGRDSVADADRPGEFAELVARPAPKVVVEWTIGASGPTERREARAWSLGAAVEAAGAGDLMSPVAVSGIAVDADPLVPLVDGDVVTLSPARARGRSGEPRLA